MPARVCEVCKIGVVLRKKNGACGEYRAVVRGEGYPGPPRPPACRFARAEFEVGEDSLLRLEQNPRLANPRPV